MHKGGFFGARTLREELDDTAASPVIIKPATMQSSRELTWELHALRTPCHVGWASPRRERGY